MSQLVRGLEKDKAETLLLKTEQRVLHLPPSSTITRQRFYKKFLSMEADSGNVFKMVYYTL